MIMIRAANDPSVFSIKRREGKAFNLEKALVALIGALSMIVKTDGSFAALIMMMMGIILHISTQN